jgi:hypothetical protein
LPRTGGVQAGDHREADGRDLERQEPRVTVPISTLLDELRNEDGERISVEDVFERTGGRAHGLLLLVLGLPEVIPMVGLSAVLAAPIFAVGAYMLARGADPRLPGWIRRRSMSRARFRKAVDRTRSIVHKLERIGRPRLDSVARAGRIQGLACMILAAVLAVPIPGINILAAFGVVSMGFGILQRDGAFVLASLLATVIAAGGMIAVLLGAITLVDRIS